MARQAPLLQYEPLLGPNHIRILTLQPAQNLDDPIRSTFKEIPLLSTSSDDTSSYEALSYTWGVPRGTQPILCDEATILVTPNCEQALRHLRRKSKPRNLWIDAICINQQSVPEKNQQVPLMGDIYRNASRGILWLGADDSPQLALTLRNAARYGTLINKMRRLYRKIRKDESSKVYPAYWTAPILSLPETDRIVELCSKEWFSRIWTVQEFLLSKSAIFLMGKVECPARALYTYYALGKDLVRRVDMEHYSMRNTLAELSPHLPDEAFERFMEEVIQLAALNASSDPRDKLYGMIAFLESKWPQLEFPAIDYGQSTSQVYEKFTRFLIHTTGSLWPFELIGTPRSQPNGLPSWVIDLRDPDRLAPFWDDFGSHGSLPKSSYDESIAAEYPGQLVVRAKKIGTIAATSSRMPFWVSGSNKTTADMDAARTACLSEWTAFVTHLDMHQDNAASPYAGHAPIKDGYSIGCSQDSSPCDEPNARALQYLTRQLDYLRLRHEPDDDVSVDSWPPPTKARQKRKLKERRAKKKEASKSSKPFDTKPRVHDMCVLIYLSNGCLAETPGDVRVGDGVYIVEGAKYAMVLRRRGSRRQRTYALVGKADIYEIGKERIGKPDKLVEDEDAKKIVLV